MPEQTLPEVARTRTAIRAEASEQPREEVGAVHDLDADGVPVRLYLPVTASAGPPIDTIDAVDTIDTITYLHGGGFVYGDPDTHDAHTRRVVNRTGRAVLFVHYRRAPEDPYPAAVDDVETATAWWADHAATHHLDRGRQFLLGDSAGANLGLGLAFRHPDRYAALALVYPFCDPAGTTYDSTVVEPELSVAECRWFWEQYAPDPAHWAEPDCDPLLHPAYGGLPPTLVQLAEHDVLSPIGHLVAERLIEAGVAAQVITYPGTHHGFWRRFDNPQAEPAAIDLAQWLTNPVAKDGAAG